MGYDKNYLSFTCNTDLSFTCNTNDILKLLTLKPKRSVYEFDYKMSGSILKKSTLE